jgi:exodeoxyribonuclease VIII
MIEAIENFQLDIEPARNPRPRYEPGWHQGMSNPDYHGSSGVSSTMLKKLLTRTPAHIEFERRHPKESTASLALGTAFHTLVLEPEKFNSEVAVMPEISGRGAPAARAEFVLANRDKAVITPDQLITAQAMAESVANHHEAALLLENTINESSIYWWYHSRDPDDDTEYRQMHKVRPDALGIAHPVCIDLKSARDATEEGFCRSIIDYGYHVSAAMYLEGINQCDDALNEMGVFACINFVFIVVEPVPPYVVGVYELSKEGVELGKAMYRKAAYAYKKAKDNNWPALPGVRQIELPQWANRAWRV